MLKLGRRFLTQVKDKESFTKAISGSNLTIVDFYAEWCGPCKMLTPVLQKVIAENSKITLLKINVDEQGDISADYDVTALPTVVAIRNGKELDRFVGLKNEKAVKEFLGKQGSS